MVNRLWADLFGVGIVDPIDDWGLHNPPSRPELLDDLAAAYTAAGFDPKPVLRAMLLSDAYQRTSRLTDPGQADPRVLARMNVKSLTAEQLFDSLSQATGYRDPTPASADLAFGWPARSPRGVFIAKFGGGAGRTDMQVSILQALALMNGDWTATQTDPATGPTVRGHCVRPVPGRRGAGRGAVPRHAQPAANRGRGSALPAAPARRGRQGPRRRRRALGAAEQPGVFGQPLKTAGEPGA